MTEIVDLDIIVPQPATLKFDGVEITVQPPQTVDLLVIGSLQDQLSSENIRGVDDNDIQRVLDQLANRIYKCIPELKGKHLTKVQLEVLIGMLVRMTAPKRSEELVKRGITPADPKAPSS